MRCSEFVELYPRVFYKTSANSFNFTPHIFIELLYLRVFYKSSWITITFPSCRKNITHQSFIRSVVLVFKTVGRQLNLSSFSSHFRLNISTMNVKTKMNAYQTLRYNKHSLLHTEEISDCHNTGDGYPWTISQFSSVPPGKFMAKILEQVVNDSFQQHHPGFITHNHLFIEGYT